jgi:hypothetical protein
MPAQATGRFTARRPTAVVSALPTANKIPAAAKARPICPEETPARCSWAGTSSAQAPVLRPAVTTAAAAPMRPRSRPATRRLAGPASPRGAIGPGGTRSAASPAVITMKAAPAASSGTASPKCSVSAPETAGPATPPTPALATDPPRARGPSAPAASQHSPAVHTTP